MKTTKNIVRNIFAVLLSVAIIAGACSSSDSESGTSASAPETISDTTASVLSGTATTTSAPSGNVEEETSLVVPFTAANGFWHCCGFLVMVRLWWLGLAVFLARFRWICLTRM